MQLTFDTQIKVFKTMKYDSNIKIVVKLKGFLPYSQQCGSETGVVTIDYLHIESGKRYHTIA